MIMSSQDLLKSFDLLPAPEKRQLASEIIRRTFALDHKIESDEARLAALYADFAAEDQAMAEEGMETYESELLAEEAG